MKQILLASLLFLGSASVFAETITFDDLPGNDTVIANGYGGLNWDNFASLDPTTLSNPSSGYTNGIVSAPNVAFNLYGNPASISSSTPFLFNSGYFTAAWNDGLAILVNGYLNGTLVDSKSFVVNTDSPTLEVFNWANIDSLTFISSGGTNVGYGGSGTHFALDNLTVNAPSPVPLPGTLVLMGGGLGVMGFFTRRKKKEG